MRKVFVGIFVGIFVASMVDKATHKAWSAGDGPRWNGLGMSEQRNTIPEPRPPSLPDLAASHPELIDRACATLSEERPEMAEVVGLWRRAARLAAAERLAAYWRTAPVPAMVEASDPDYPPREPRADADRVMADLTPFGSGWDPVPRRADGGWDWHYNGPNGDREWGWMHNRHTNLERLFQGWRATGDTAYARRIDAMLWDWIVTNPYPGVKSSLPTWRGLEAFERAVHWTRIVHHMRRAGALSDATLVAVTASLPDHADYAWRFHAQPSNWLSMEMNGLATLGCAWPEFRDAPAWRTYAAETIAPMTERLCYPDGAQNEFTFHYHQVTERSFSALVRVFDAAGYGALVPRSFRDGIARMWEATAAVVDQRGFGPMNNDSDEDQIAKRFAARAHADGRPDWLYIATAGAEGEAPAGLPSRLLPWAGQLTMRSGWGPNDQWAWFDAGPLGAGHTHNDMLHLSVRHGRFLLVDAGRFHYVGDAWRAYFTGTAAHNAVLVDGAGQLPGPRFAKDPLPDDTWAITPDWDFCRAAHTSGFTGLPPAVVHQRCVLYRRGLWWLVVDTVELDQARHLTWHWHLHPDCTVDLADGVLRTTEPDQGNVRVAPLLPGLAAPLAVRGREEPTPLGWYSPRYGTRVPTTTAVWEADAPAGRAVQAWLVTTAIGPAPTPRAAVRVAGDVLVGRIGDEEVSVPLAVGLPSIVPMATSMEVKAADQKGHCR